MNLWRFRPNSFAPLSVWQMWPQGRCMDTQIYRHVYVCTHTQRGHYWLTLLVHVNASTGWQADRFFIHPHPEERPWPVTWPSVSRSFHIIFYLRVVVLTFHHWHTRKCGQFPLCTWTVRRLIKAFAWRWPGISWLMGSQINDVKPGHESRDGSS